MHDPDFADLTINLDLQAFWDENDLCLKNTRPPNKTDTVSKSISRCAMTFSPDDHWLFEFLDVSSTIRYYHDKAYRDALHRQANALTRKMVGRAFFDEDTWQHSPRRIENLFACEFTYTEGSTP